MTRSRLNPDKLLFGILGGMPGSGEILARWNALFRAKKLDASMDRYPTTVGTLPERLSEMFHFDRRGYIVSKPLQKAIISYLDRLDPSAEGEGSADTVLCDRGILVGFYCGNDDIRRAQIWQV